MKRFVLVLIMLLFSNICFAAEGLTIFNENGNFGLKNLQGEIIVKPVYKKMILLGESSYIVQKHGKFGLIDSEGKVLVPIKYYIVNEFWADF